MIYPWNIIYFSILNNKKVNNIENKIFMRIISIIIFIVIIIMFLWHNPGNVPPPSKPEDFL